jgi:hypothetical protein
MLITYLSNMRTEAQIIWYFLMKNPHIKTFADLPEHLHINVQKVVNPLCYIFLNKRENHCKGCPLATYSDEIKINCFSDRSLYNRWLNAKTDDERRIASETIYLNLKTFDIDSVGIKISRYGRFYE